MVAQHLGVVHLIDVVAGENQHIVGVVAGDEGNILIDGVGGSLVPVRALAPGIGRQHGDTAVGAVQIPGLSVADIFVEFQGLILGQDAHGVNMGVDAVGQGEIDNAVFAAKGDGRLGGILRENLQPAALAAGQQHGHAALFLKIHNQVPP